MIFLFWFVNICFVVEIFKVSLSNVVNRRSDGNIEKFKVFFMFMLFKNIISVSERLIVIKMLSKFGGMGSIIDNIIIIVNIEKVVFFKFILYLFFGNF